MQQSKKHDRHALIFNLNLPYDSRNLLNRYLNIDMLTENRFL